MSFVPPNVSQGSAATVLRRLDLVIRRRLDGMLNGDYLGLVPGHGSEQGETRMYSPGDDVRRIDWNVTARMTDPHVRETIADRELECWIVIDVSPSLDFGTALCEKRDLAVSAASAIGFLTDRTGNRIGAVIADTRGSKIVPARGGKDHLLGLLKRIIEIPRVESGESDLGASLKKTSSIAIRRGLVVVISDFLNPVDTWAKELGRLAVRNEVLCIEVVDPRELELPEVGMLTLLDPASGHTLDIQTSNDKIRNAYAEAAKAQRQQIASAIRVAGADHLQLRTDRDWLLDVVRYVSSRRNRTASITARTR